MESYVVRIYRRGRKKDSEIAGLIDVIETGETKKFSGQEELWDVIRQDSTCGTQHEDTRKADRKKREEEVS